MHQPGAVTNDYFYYPLFRSIIFSINQLVVFSGIRQKMVKNVDQFFPKPKNDVLECRV